MSKMINFARQQVGYWSPTDSLYRAKRNGVVHTPAQFPGDWEVVQV